MHDKLIQSGPIVFEFWTSVVVHTSSVDLLFLSIFSASLYVTAILHSWSFSNEMLNQMLTQENKDLCKEVERLQMELSMLSKERVDLLARSRESETEPIHRDDFQVCHLNAMNCLLMNLLSEQVKEM